MWMTIIALQQASSASVASQIDLNTVLLTIVLAISGWTLNTVLRHMTKLTQIEQQIWGKDGKNGHSSELRDLRDGLRMIEKVVSKVLHRVERLEEKSGVRPALGDDDTEEDRRRGP